MGYECDARAGDVLRLLMERCRESTGHPDRFTRGGETFLWQLGPERADGGVSGVVKRVVRDSGGRLQTRAAGTFRVSASGGLVEAPVWMRDALLQKSRP